jgi:hypothetical protein
MIFPFRHTKTKQFLALTVGVVFLCMSLWQSSHVHHQHGAGYAELPSWGMSFASGFSGGHHDHAEPHGEHSHGTPDKTAYVYKHRTGWKTPGGKADGDSPLEMPAVSWDIVIFIPDDSINQTP